MYKIFFYNHTLYIGNAVPAGVEVSEVWQYTTNKAMRKFLFQQLRHNTAQVVQVLTPDPFFVWTRFCKFFEIREAAGGLVQNEQGEFLFIRRRGKWDLPKGHLDPGELSKEAALREVSEECGIKDMKITQSLGITYHTYDIKLRPVLKPTSWYLMKYEGWQSGAPQLEEEIEELRWVRPEEISSLLLDAFPSIADVLAQLQNA